VTGRDSKTRGNNALTRLGSSDHAVSGALDERTLGAIEKRADGEARDGRRAAARAKGGRQRAGGRALVPREREECGIWRLGSWSLEGEETRRRSEEAREGRGARRLAEEAPIREGAR
jgi:hypothetical protein